MRESREKATASGAAFRTPSGSASCSPHGAASSAPSSNAFSSASGTASRRLPLAVAVIAVVLAFVALAFVAFPSFLANDPADGNAQFAGAGQLAGGKGESSAVTIVAEGLSKNYDDARENSVYLQYLIDAVSRQGGGTVEIPEGTFCFAATGEHRLGSYAILAKNNVKVAGAGQDKTKLMPIGNWAETRLHKYGVDMFAYFGISDGTYLENADFEHFTIDGSLTQGNPATYNASGKGFYFKLFKDCDWRNVTVKNTDGTGFGVDFPINSTIENCVAIGCGKNATAADAGASGFGIGTGYSDQESIFIGNCEAYDNTKYGIFFEHQTRFTSGIEASGAEGFVVVECVASGNLYNFGGARAHDVTYKKCTSKVSESAEREAYSKRAFCFENHSCRTEVTDCMVEQRFFDVGSSDPCFEAVRWAFECGMLENVFGEAEIAEDAIQDAGAKAGEMLFHPDREMLRSEAVVLLWCYADRPGRVWLGGSPSIPVGYSDVSADDYFADAVLWMGSLSGVDAGTALNSSSTTVMLPKFRGGDSVTWAELITMLWRMSGKPEVSLGHGALGEASAYEGLFFERPYAWALDQGLISKADFEADPYSACTRADVVMLLHAYDAR